MYDVWKKSFLKVIQVCQRRMNWKSELKSFSSDRKKNVWGKDIWCNFDVPLSSKILKCGGTNINFGDAHSQRSNLNTSKPKLLDITYKNNLKHCHIFHWKTCMDSIGTQNFSSLPLSFRECTSDVLRFVLAITSLRYIIYNVCVSATKKVGPLPPLFWHVGK